MSRDSPELLRAQLLHVAEVATRQVLSMLAVEPGSFDECRIDLSFGKIRITEDFFVE